jgi:hypothetical protein
MKSDSESHLEGYVRVCFLCCSCGKISDYVCLWREFALERNNTHARNCGKKLDGRPRKHMKMLTWQKQLLDSPSVVRIVMCYPYSLFSLNRLGRIPAE